MKQRNVVIILAVLLGLLGTLYFFTLMDKSPSEANTAQNPVAFPVVDPINTAQGEEPAPGTTSVNVYYYDAKRDTENGNVLCSARGLVAVPHTIAATEAPLRAALERLLAGEPAGEGLEAFPTGVTLEGVSVANGVATIRLSDPSNRTSGGSCRASVLRAQLEATARQFPSVTSVRVEPDTIFQP
jgi:spore germination protein GerM